MTVDLLRPPTQLTHAEAVQVSQQAPGILQRDTSWNIPWPLSLLVASDAPEKWSIYENLLLSCLRTGDNASAKACLDKLKARFGEQNERVTGLMGLYYEAVGNNGELEQFLRQYEKKMTDSPTNMVRKTIRHHPYRLTDLAQAVRKRRVALLKTLERPADAIVALTDLLEESPVDAEAWAELSELYTAQGLHAQAIFCLEEVLLITPNAWNVCYTIYAV